MIVSSGILEKEKLDNKENIKYEENELKEDEDVSDEKKWN